MVASTFTAENLGFVHLFNPKLAFRTQRSTGSRFVASHTVQLISGRIRRKQYRCLILAHTQIKCAASSGRNQQELRFSEDDYGSEPFWSSLVRTRFGGLKSLFTFLVEQPGQLKYIEWPSFQSTLKTATLTLVLVACLIVALASVDSALCYLLVLLLRKST